MKKTMAKTIHQHRHWITSVSVLTKQRCWAKRLTKKKRCTLTITHQKDFGIEVYEARVGLPDIEQHVDGVGVVHVVDGLVDGQHHALDVVLQYFAFAKFSQRWGRPQILEVV